MEQSAIGTHWRKLVSECKSTQQLCALVEMYVESVLEFECERVHVTELHDVTGITIVLTHAGGRSTYMRVSSTIANVLGEVASTFGITYVRAESTSGVLWRIKASENGS